MRFPSKTELRILQILIAKGELTGLEIHRASEGTVARGGIYTLLGRLAHKGFVESRKVDPPEGAGGLPRRLYKVTGLGERIVQAAELFDMEAVLA